MKIGSHCAMKSPEYFLGSVKEALSYNSNALMIYTGAPQNSRRTALDKLYVPEAKQLLNENNIPIEDVIVHAPYLINLANALNEQTFQAAIDILTLELERTSYIGAKYLVLHPGSHVGAGTEEGIKHIIKGLNQVLENQEDVVIALETMSGKGTEIGRTFEDIAAIISGVTKKHLVKVCLDTCHLHDAGYDISDWDSLMQQFDEIVGLDKIAVIHINDSKNIKGSHKDRHANFGFGEIGFDTLINIVNSPLTANVVKILETPYVEGKPPYKDEIEMIKSNEFNQNLFIDY